jgi:hypothetical protein
MMIIKSPTHVKYQIFTTKDNPEFQIIILLKTIILMKIIIIKKQ